MVLLIFLFLGAYLGKAAPYPHVRLCLGHECVTNVLLAPRHPSVEVLLAQRVQRHVAGASEEVCDLGTGVAHDVGDICLEFLAEGLKRKIIDILAEGVFDLTANGSNTQNDVGGEDGSRDSDPTQVVPHLERQHHDVDPGDLRDGNGVGNGEGSVENTLDTDEDVVEGDNGSD